MKHRLPYWLSLKDRAIASAILDSQNWQVSFQGSVETMDIYWLGFPESVRWISLGEGWEYNNSDIPVLMVDNAVFSINPESFDYKYRQLFYQLQKLIRDTAKKLRTNNES